MLARCVDAPLSARTSICLVAQTPLPCPMACSPPKSTRREYPSGESDAAYRGAGGRPRTPTACHRCARAQ
eukprot:6173974-Pleurochrysis_carterae.AAC.1